MYISGNWYSLNANSDTYDDNDPIRSLDVTVLSESILDPVLGIGDLRKSTRIDFVGGIRNCICSTQSHFKSFTKPNQKTLKAKIPNKTAARGLHDKCVM